MNRLKKFLFITCLLALSAVASAQTVQNVRVRQMGKTIEITYDLDEDAIVSLKGYSGTQELNVVHLHGEVGQVMAGTKHKIIWDVLEDYKEFIFDNVTFAISTKSLYSGNRTLIAAQYGVGAIPQHSGGLMLGQIYKYAGWYVDFRSNFNYEKPTDGLTCGEGGLVGEELPFYSGKRTQSHMMLTVGALVDLTGNHWRKSLLALYVGAGYGSRYSLWETTDGQLIQYQPTSYKGVAAKAGLIGSYKGITLSAGVASIAFKYMEVEVGLGYTINHKRKK